MNMKFFNYIKFGNIGLICLLSFLSINVSAQNEATGNESKITGIVTDAVSKTPLVGVRVQAYNDKNYAAMTKEDGLFSIKVPDYVSSLSFVLEGYNMAVSSFDRNSNIVNVILYSDKFSPDYSVSTLATKAKSVAISSMNMDVDVDPQLQQKMMGDIYSVTRSGQIGVGNSLLINGINTLNINARQIGRAHV